jgi:hypothetical protein
MDVLRSPTARGCTLVAASGSGAEQAGPALAALAAAAVAPSTTWRIDAATGGGAADALAAAEEVLRVASAAAAESAEGASVPIILLGPEACSCDRLLGRLQSLLLNGSGPTGALRAVLVAGSLVDLQRIACGFPHLVGPQAYVLVYSEEAAAAQLESDCLRALLASEAAQGALRQHTARAAEHQCAEAQRPTQPADAVQQRHKAAAGIACAVAEMHHGVVKACTAQRPAAAAQPPSTVAHRVLAAAVRLHRTSQKLLERRRLALYGGVRRAARVRAEL